MTKLALEVFGSEKIILAGGGKKRLVRLREDGLNIENWLNGVCYLFPSFTAQCAGLFEEHGGVRQEEFILDVEEPLFNLISKYGWHRAQRAILHNNGFGEVFERWPHTRSFKMIC